MTEPTPEVVQHKAVKRILIAVLICVPLIWGTQEYLQSQRDEISGHWYCDGHAMSLNANGNLEISFPGTPFHYRGYWWRIGNLAGFHEWHDDLPWFRCVWWFATNYDLVTLRIAEPDTIEMTDGTGATRTVQALKPAVQPAINPAAGALK
ncbi:MAG: hypothetical protein JWN70_6374 [Planctomycetaceae bacterium]|nr:hypothetical protein [Planctomycetaceae bacterium]